MSIAALACISRELLSVCQELDVCFSASQSQVGRRFRSRILPFVLVIRCVSASWVLIGRKTGEEEGAPYPLVVYLLRGNVDLQVRC